MFDTERMIAEIKQRPAIYATKSELYSSRAARSVAWTEVAEILCPNWHNLPDTIQTAELDMIKAKWRNIRDYFVKELKRRKDPPSTVGEKKYVYHDQLNFLIPHVEIVETEGGKYTVIGRRYRKAKKGSTSPYPEIINSDSTYEALLQNNESDPLVDSTDSSSQIDSKSIIKLYVPKPMPMCVTSGTSPSEQEMKMDEEGDYGDDDYDRMFLLSMLPSMRRVPEHMKLDVKIRMQQVLAEVLRASEPR